MSESLPARMLPWILIPAAGLSLYLGYLRCGGPERRTPGHTLASTVPQSRFTDRAMPAVAAVVAAAYRGVPIAAEGLPHFAEPNHGSYVALRSGGRLRSSAWHQGGTVGGALIAATERARDQLAPADLAAVDAAEICVSHSYRTEVLTSRSAFLDDTERGIRGIELTYGRGKLRRHSPTEMLARNLSFPNAVAKLQEQEPLGDPALASGAVTARSFDCEQILVQLGPPPRATLMQRGNRLVSIEQVTREQTVALARRLGDWMIRDVKPDGRAIYKWWPSRNEESQANNMIRQWMGTIALVRLGRDRDDPAVLALAERNIRYNLDHFYREENGLGLIEWNGKVKLGAVALAAIALIEHPNRAAFATKERALVATTFHLHHEDGSFTTFYQPAGRSGQNNFYPGETLLLWSILYAEQPDPALLARFLASFRYYRAWHRNNQNPAFIPWHTQAYVKMWQETRDPELAAFVFEMNDWLIGIQEWDAAVHPDTQGRFYDATRAFFGPPHASSTGVYLEGLIEAYRLAGALGEADRRERYRRAIVRGLRSVMQLQFVDDVDMYYVSDRDHVYGGLRTTVYDNAIRIDNVQHNLLGLFRIVDTLAAEEYRP